MSENDAKETTAFFPPIDKAFLRDLDRHLRSPEPVVPVEDPPAQRAPHPTVDDMVEVVRGVASGMEAMTARITLLEADLAATKQAHDGARAEITELRRLLEASEAAMREEGSLRERAELLAAQLLKRSDGFERDLTTTRADLARVAEAVVESFGASVLGRAPTKEASEPRPRPEAIDDPKKDADAPKTTQLTG